MTSLRRTSSHHGGPSPKPTGTPPNPESEPQREQRRTAGAIRTPDSEDMRTVPGPGPDGDHSWEAKADRASMDRWGGMGAPISDMGDDLKQELLRLALETDVAGEHHLRGWRLDAVCAARWLLRAAALAPAIPPGMRPLLRSIRDAADRLSGAGWPGAPPDPPPDGADLDGALLEDP